MCVAAALVVTFAAAMLSLCVRNQMSDERASNLWNLWCFWLAAAALWSALTVVAWQLVRGGSDSNGSPPDAPASPAPIPMTRRAACHHAAAMLFIVAVAAGARVLLVVWSTPQLSDDLYRYIFDGRTLARGCNPYARSPNDTAVDNPNDAVLVSRINHSDLVTLYLPTSQYVFALLAMCQGSAFDPIAGRTFRMGFVAFDLIVIALLLGRLNADRRSPWWAVLYAWHPLAISEVAGSGHQDVIGIALLISVLWLLDRSGRGAGKGHAVLAGALFAASLCVKPVVAPLAIAIAWIHRDRRQLVVLGAGTACLTLALLGAPFLLMDGAILGLFETAGTFVSTWAHNGSIHALAAYICERHAATILCGGLLATVLIGALAVRCELWRMAMIYLFAAVLLSSTAHPWYLLWALALLPLRFDAALWTLSLTIGWSYVVLGDMGTWDLPVWVSAIQYAPVYAMIAVRMTRWRHGTRTRKLG